MSKYPLIGFIGQGFIGKNYADDFAARGYNIVRYSQESKYIGNKEKIAECEIVFIAVPTPTTSQGFNCDILKEVIGLVGVGQSAVIKSTIIPGTCEQLQALYPDRFVFHSPEFLTEAKATFDTAHPTRNIVGYPFETEEYKQRAQAILDILPPTSVSFSCRAKEAEMIKYASNCFLIFKIIYANILYDLVAKEGLDWSKIKDGLAADPRIGASHLDPVHASGVNGQPGRGAGGHCFLKDFAAWREYAEKSGVDKLSIDLLKAVEVKNIALLKQSGKDLDLLAGVYGQI